MTRHIWARANKPAPTGNEDTMITSAAQAAASADIVHQNSRPFRFPPENAQARIQTAVTALQIVLITGFSGKIQYAASLQHAPAAAITVKYSFNLFSMVSGPEPFHILIFSRKNNKKTSCRQLFPHKKRIAAANTTILYDQSILCQPLTAPATKLSWIRLLRNT